MSQNCIYIKYIRSRSQSLFFLNEWGAAAAAVHKMPFVSCCQCILSLLVFPSLLQRYTDMYVYRQDKQQIRLCPFTIIFFFSNRFYLGFLFFILFSNSTKKWCCHYCHHHNHRSSNQSKTEKKIHKNFNLISNFDRRNLLLVTCYGVRIQACMDACVHEVAIPNRSELIVVSKSLISETFVSHHICIFRFSNSIILII